MAQHDFAPAWLNFPPLPSSRKIAEPSNDLDYHSDVSNNQHSFCNGLESSNERGCRQINYGKKEKNGWRGKNAFEGVNSHSNRGVNSRSRQAGFHIGKKNALRKTTLTEKENGKNDGPDLKQFEAEDFPSLNPECEREVAQGKSVAAGVWEHPLNPKSRASKMMIIKKGTKEEMSSGYPITGFSNLSSQPNIHDPRNGIGLNVTKSLTPKPTTTLIKESRSNFSCVDSSQPRLMKLARARVDKKSVFLKALKQDRFEDHDGDMIQYKEEKCNVQNRNRPLTMDENLNGYDHEQSRVNGNALVMTPKLIHSSTFPQTDVLSSSLEAEHRLLKAMGWQEDSENDDTCAPLTEDEMKEFQAISEQLQKNGFRKNCLKNGLPGDYFQNWKNGTFSHTTDNDEVETTSSDTSDDEVV
ncbi:vasculin-like [Polypterus senegalus]